MGSFAERLELGWSVDDSLSRCESALAKEVVDIESEESSSSTSRPRVVELPAPVRTDPWGVCPGR